MESMIRSLCFFRPRAITITSPVGGSEGGTGSVEGAGEDGAGDEGREGGGGGQGQGEARGEGGDVIAEGERSVKSRLLCGTESRDSHLASNSPFKCWCRKRRDKEKERILDFSFYHILPKKKNVYHGHNERRKLKSLLLHFCYILLNQNH